MDFEKNTPGEKLREMGLVPGDLDAEGNEIEPERLVLFQKLSDLHNEVQVELEQAMNAVSDIDDPISEEAKTLAKEVLERLKERH